LSLLVLQTNFKQIHMFFRQTLNVIPARISQNLSLFFCLAFLSFFLGNCKPASNEAEENLETDGAEQAAYQQFLKMRDPALNLVPQERMLTAINYMNSQRTSQPTALAWQERGPNNIGGRSRSIMIDSPARRVKTSIAYPSLSVLDVLSRDLHLTPDMTGCSVKPMYVLVRHELQINASIRCGTTPHQTFCDRCLVLRADPPTGVLRRKRRTGACANPRCSSPASSSARRVLPTPTGPVRVSSRVVRTRRLSSTSSSERSMKLLNRAGNPREVAALTASVLSRRR